MTSQRSGTYVPPPARGEVGKVPQTGSGAAVGDCGGGVGKSHGCDSLGRQIGAQRLEENR